MYTTKNVPRTTVYSKRLYADKREIITPNPANYSMVLIKFHPDSPVPALEEREIYVQSKQYIEEVAKEKLGLVKKDEILFKPDESR